MLELAMRNAGAVGHALAALAFLGFATHLALGWRGGRKASILLGTLAASALWAGLSAAYAVAAVPALWTAQAIADGLRAGGWLLFLIVLLGGERQTARWGAILLVVPAATLLVPFAQPLEAGVTTAAARLPFMLLLGIAVGGLVLIEQVFRRSAEQARWSIKPLCLGLGASFVFDLYLYADALLFGRLDADVWAARSIAQALVIPFVALATARNKDWTLDIALSRGMVFHSTAFLACGAYLLAIAGAGYYVRYFGGSWGRTLQAGFVFAALLLLGWVFSSGTLRSRLRVFINKNFFSYRYDYRAEWLRFTNLLSKSDADLGVGQRSIQALADLVESPAGALWLRDGEGVYAPAARWNLPEVPARVAAQDSLARFLRSTGWVVSLEQFRAQPSRYPQLQLPAWLSALPAAWLVVPIVAQDELIGFVVLATPRAGIELDWEVLDLLKTAGRQLGSFLAQIQASEALLEARKFDAFNKMSAFVVHDIKNLVAQLTLLLRNAERHRHNARFQDDMLSTVRHVAERMNKLLLQLSTGSRGEENVVAIDLARLARRVVDAKPAAPPIELEAPDEVFTLAHEQRLERVLGHLVQNAIEATASGGTVRVRVSAEAANAVVEVADSGCGMSETFMRERLFRPFQSTKPSGMGIGAYETAQYVKEMGGSIHADSRPGAGTRIKVVLVQHRASVPQIEQAHEVA
jgi:putative PEP-CTERM system histidine kinase